MVRPNELERGKPFGAMRPAWALQATRSFNSDHVKIIENLQHHENTRINDKKEVEIKNDPEQVLDNVWSIGGERGWYYGNTLWRIRGYLDKLSGGVGLRRGRTNLNRLASGDVLDFWRVIVADRDEQRLLLYAEMKLPGEAWLEFKIIQKGKKQFLTQTATFRPSGLPGRIYWYLLLPFHFFIFDGMINNIEKHKIKTG